MLSNSLVLVILRVSRVFYERDRWSMRKIKDEKQGGWIFLKMTSSDYCD